MDHQGLLNQLLEKLSAASKAYLNAESEENGLNAWEKAAKSDTFYNAVEALEEASATMLDFMAVIRTQGIGSDVEIQKAS